MVNAIGVRKAGKIISFLGFIFDSLKKDNSSFLDLALQRGTLFNVEEAHKIELLDEVAPDLQSATVSAERELEAFLKIPGADLSMKLLYLTILIINSSFLHF